MTVDRVWKYAEALECSPAYILGIEPEALGVGESYPMEWGNIDRFISAVKNAIKQDEKCIYLE